MVEKHGPRAWAGLVTNLGSATDNFVSSVSPSGKWE